MSAFTNINIQIDSELKAQAEALFAEFGMDLATAFDIFVRQCLREGRIPFEISLHPSSTSEQDRVDAAKSLFGILPPEASLEQAKEERLSKI